MAPRDPIQLQQQIDALMRRVTDAQQRALVAAWAHAWDEIATLLVPVMADALVAGTQVTATQLRAARRVQAALAIVLARLEELVGESAQIITSPLAGLVDAAGAAQASIIDSQLPPGSPLADPDSWSRVDRRQVDAIVQRTTEHIVSRLRPLSTAAEQAMRRELVRGVAVGSNPRVTARRMVARSKDGFAGGLTRAMTIARTETLDAYRAAAQAGEEQHADVLDGWVWLATLSARTCPACLSMHGREFPLTQAGPEGHPQCRCSRMPKVKTWADLGFDGIEEPPPLIGDADAFFTGLTPAQQRDLLGRRGYLAWQAGVWPREEWAVLRSTDGWRDSWVNARPPQVAD